MAHKPIKKDKKNDRSTFLQLRIDPARKRKYLREAKARGFVVAGRGVATWAMAVLDAEIGGKK